MRSTGNCHPLPSDRSAPGRARDYARRQMAEATLEERVRRTVVLVVSELVTNAVQHAEPPYGIVVAVDDGLIRIDVVDHGSQAPTEPVDAPGDGLLPGGRGLAIVRRLAAAWGVERNGAGKSVWADVPVAAGS